MFPSDGSKDTYKTKSIFKERNTDFIMNLLNNIFNNRLNKFFTDIFSFFINLSFNFFIIDMFFNFF